MKFYKADIELEQILMNHGFQDFTSKRDKVKGKKSFKLSQNSSKEIYLNFINIQVINHLKIQDAGYLLDESSLKTLLLIFKLNSNELKEIGCDKSFSIAEALKGLQSISFELDGLLEFSINHLRIRKLKRIIDTYQSINLD